MVTEDGHAKIIDFGLAKLVEPLEGVGSDIETLTLGETDPGKVRHPRQSRWLDEWGRLKGGRPKY
jgi:hypothetical protein